MDDTRLAAMPVLMFCKAPDSQSRLIVADRLRQCLADGGDANVYLGLNRAKESRALLRDEYLRAAADLLIVESKVRRGKPQSDMNRRAYALQLRVAEFIDKRWPAWSKHGIPENALPIDRHLFEAQEWADIPRTQKQLQKILSDK